MNPTLQPPRHDDVTRDYVGAGIDAAEAYANNPFTQIDYARSVIDGLPNAIPDNAQLIHGVEHLAAIHEFLQTTTHSLALEQDQFLDEKTIEDTPTQQLTGIVGAVRRFLGGAAISMSAKPPRGELKHMVIQEEARIGGSLFGLVPPGKSREFFRETANSWIWNEGHRDKTKPMITTRYEIFDDRVVKTQDNQRQKVIYGEELQHLNQAVAAYSREVRQLYATLRG